MEKTLEKKRIYTGTLLKLNADRVSLSGGKTSFREYVSHQGAAAAIPFVSDDEIILIKQYRYAISDNLLEIPAGIIEKGENPEETIKRELIEETGYKANIVQYLGWFYPSVGYTDEKIYLFKAGELQLTDNKRDEEIELEKVSFKKAISMIEDGKITDGKTIIAILTCHH
jgi:ADP-ribose pyrophosphatase